MWLVAGTSTDKSYCAIFLEAHHIKKIKIIIKK